MPASPRLSALGGRLRRHVPILEWLPAYQRSRLRPDLLAGCVVAGLAVPQSLGYATIAGVPVEVGLYSVPVALIAYAIFGTSRQLMLGPASTVAVLSGSLVAAMRPADLTQAIQFTSAIAAWAGIVLIVAARLRVGWVAEFLSKPIVTGFVLGLSLLVIIGELPSLLGINVESGDVLARIRALLGGLDEIDAATTLIGCLALVVLFAGSRALPAVPWSLVALVGGLFAPTVLGLTDENITTVGPVPAGLPGVQLPLVPIDRLAEVIIGGTAIAFVGLAEGLSAARLFAVKGGYRVDTDQELLAAGAGNLACGITGGFSVAGSLSKTAACDRSGGTTQMSGLGAAALSVLVILVLAPFLEDLPKAVLSAIVIHAVWGLIDVESMRRYLATRRNDFVAAMVAVVGVLAFGPLVGLLLAVAQSILGLVYRSSRVSIDVMGRIPGEKAAWGSVENHPERNPAPGILVLRINEPLFWVNAAQVKDSVLACVEAHPGTKALILDLESSDQLETTSADMLRMLHQRLADWGVDLYLVRVRFAVRTILRRTGLRAELGEDHLWHSISQGVREARRVHGLKSAGGDPVDDAVDQAGVGPTGDAVGEAEVVVARTVDDEPEQDPAAPLAARPGAGHYGRGVVQQRDEPVEHRRVSVPQIEPRPDVRLIAADLDGTLLDDEKALHDHFWPMVDELFARDIWFCPASGRQYATLYRQFRDVADEMIFIAENGAYVVKGTEEISSDSVDPDLVQRLVAAVRDLAADGADVGIVVCGKRAAYIERTDRPFREQVDLYYAAQQVVDDLLDRPDDSVLKFTVYDFGSAERTVAPALAPFAAEAQVALSGKHWVDVMNLSTNKGAGIRCIQTALRITPAQTMVFGDFLNDLEMMDAAEYSFAMHNAHPLLRERARYVAPPNTENGVVRTISSVLGLPWVH